MSGAWPYTRPLPTHQSQVERYKQSRPQQAPSSGMSPVTVVDKTSNWRMDPMSHARRFDHVGITVADLDRVTAFFVGLRLEVEGTRMFLEGEFLDTVLSGSADAAVDAGSAGHQAPGCSCFPTVTCTRSAVPDPTDAGR